VKGVRVRRVHREQLGASAREAWYDPDRRPFVEGDLAFVPVREGYPADLELPERAPYRGRGYQVLGDQVVFHGRRPTDAQVEEVVRWIRPRGVLWTHSLSAVTRTPQTERLWGERGEVCHQENGCRYVLDPSCIMFAMGNREERARMGAVVRPGERVGDLCAGIGYFTIPMARAGAVVQAIELNPLAYSYLLRSVAANDLADQVQAVCGDCRHHLSGTYDRVVIGHFDMLSFLPAALAHVREGSVLHLHTLDARGDAIRKIVETAGFSPTMAIHRVKKYAPGRWHVVWDVRL
jgi:tRNA wybutosine-synthesizing protein 2